MANRPLLIYPPVPLPAGGQGAAAGALAARGEPAAADGTDQRGTRRALQADAKEQRRSRILDAAAEVLGNSPNRDIGVAEVAAAAGLAKGTVYLYFPSKEELLLALHERQTESFFAALAEASQQHRLDFDGLFGLIDRFLLSSQLYLPLASRCLGVLDFSVLPSVRQAYRSRIAGHLALVGPLVERDFQGLEPGGGVSLLLASYGLIMGLWQLLSPDATSNPYPLEFRRDTEAALRALWRGRVSMAAV